MIFFILLFHSQILFTPSSTSSSPLLPPHLLISSPTSSSPLLPPHLLSYLLISPTSQLLSYLSSLHLPPHLLSYLPISSHTSSNFIFSPPWPDDYYRWRKFSLCRCKLYMHACVRVCVCVCVCVCVLLHFSVAITIYMHLYVIFHHISLYFHSNPRFIAHYQPLPQV